jgi:hypothetical protein
MIRKKAAYRADLSFGAISNSESVAQDYVQPQAGFGK